MAPDGNGLARQRRVVHLEGGHVQQAKVGRDLIARFNLDNVSNDEKQQQRGSRLRIAMAVLAMRDSNPDMALAALPSWNRVIAVVRTTTTRSVSDRAESASDDQHQHEAVDDQGAHDACDERYGRRRRHAIRAVLQQKRLGGIGRHTGAVAHVAGIDRRMQVGELSDRQEMLC
ncbi:hypothetical protein PBRA_000039, partial [Plasmodiophora brassicae]